MVGRQRFLRALVASWALGAGLTLAGPATAAPTAPPTAPATAAPTAARGDTEPEPDEAPLGVTIQSMTPASLPAADGDDVVVTGTVTNRTDETWRSISLFVVDGSAVGNDPLEPMRTPGELARAMDTPYDEVIGGRVVNEGETLGRVEELPAGATASYRIVVPAEAIAVDQAGVYWFGVHALGSSDSVADDKVADGRARTFIPSVPTRFDSTPVAVSLVVPLTRALHWTADGTVADEDEWAADLDRGRLSRVLGLLDASPGPVTVLVDPAVIDAVAHLAAGNRPRTLGPPPDDETATPSTGAASPTQEPSADAQPPSDSETAQVAARWLERLDTALEGNEVRSLPYGNVDVAATLGRDPDLLTLALAQRSPVLEEIAGDTGPVVAPPGGYLDADSIRATDPASPVLVTDRMFGSDAPVVADADGHRLVVASYGAVQGSPGPGPSLSTVGVRQRLLAEAALRVVRSDRQPLVAVLPTDGVLADPVTFWNGFDAPWIDLETLSDVAADTTPVAVSLDDLDYPEAQEGQELGPATIDGVADLVEAADTLQNLLVDNTGIAGTLTEEALSGLSYHVRYDQAGGRYATDRSRDWVASILDDVQIDAPDGVTLASDQGTFVVTLTNTLDHRVAVSVRATSDDQIEVTGPERVVLAPGARDTVRLTTRTRNSSVHRVELAVTDQSGHPLGSTSDVPIRSTQVGGVIWIIMGVGVGILFLAIGIRLARRVAAARRGDPDAGSRAARTRAVDEQSQPVEVS